MKAHILPVGFLTPEQRKGLSVLDPEKPASITGRSERYEGLSAGQHFVVRHIQAQVATELVRQGFARYILGGVVLTDEGYEAKLAVRPPVVRRSATFSPDGKYRYTLERWWGDGTPLCWCLLNPSKADDERDDPTVRRLIGFTRFWGFSGLMVVNLFAYRRTSPEWLIAEAKRDPLSIVGPDNEAHIGEAIDQCAEVVVGWGAFLVGHRRWLVGRPVVEEMARFAGKAVSCLGTTKSGDPLHPLYVVHDAKRKRWPS